MSTFGLVNSLRLGSSPQIPALIDHLFRVESGKLVAILTRIFGPHQLELAEDVVQDTLLDAMQTWQYRGIPQNPGAWLYTVAKNKSLNILRRDQYRKKYSADARYAALAAQHQAGDIDHYFSEEEISDDLLRMMFVCCHPAVSPDSQVSLILKTLCGFSIPEIGHAFLTSEENINKRLVRARKKIRQANLRLEMLQGEELRKRLDAVLQAIYLLFNEGYSASSGDQLIRYELCGEAIRLAEILATSPAISHKSNVFALLALMFFNASRFHARQDSQGNILSMEEQDRSLWNRELIRKGFLYISRTSEPNSVSVYHILAAISCQHCSSPDFASTDWKSILELYDNLILIDHSPVAILNRAIALSKVHGAAAGLRELEGIRQNTFLSTYYLYFATQAEFYLETREVGKAIAAYTRAIELAPLKAEKELLEKKMSRFTAPLPGA